MSPRQTSAISFTKRLLLFVVIGTTSIILIKASYALGPKQSPESTGQERKLKVTEYKDLPLEVKVRNLQSKRWLKDLEIEVKNISGRPIYFIVAYLQFPDDPPPQSDGVVGCLYIMVSPMRHLPSPVSIIKPSSDGRFMLGLLRRAIVYHVWPARNKVLARPLLELSMRKICIRNRRSGDYARTLSFPAAIALAAGLRYKPSYKCHASAGACRGYRDLQRTTPLRKGRCHPVEDAAPFSLVELASGNHLSRNLKVCQ